MATRRATSSTAGAVRRRRWRAAGAALLALLAAAPGAAGAAPPKRAGEADWVRISYRDLLDAEALTHSGAKLGDALLRGAPRGEVQPFLDPYTSLLGYAVQMLFGADSAPQSSLAERYPAGGSQPAWAALLREGRYAVSADGAGRARVFVPGDDPRAAYRRAYSLLRHPLTAALPTGAPLQVEVYGYRNDYAAAELRLNPEPYRFRARSFPPRGRPLDLGELETFFRSGGQLEGAEISPDGGLVLFASPNQQQRLGGEPVALADLAVAYRAVAHAGDAEAFVSLDRNADPTLATVNFGGLLEDTRVGAAVLAADMRFKTICSGLDSVSLQDVREKVRRAVPSFMSNAERQFLADPLADLEQWVTARYWYYPDSCGVETDEDERLAAITKTQLTADVERVQRGAAAARGAKATLPAVYRENIREINGNYERYAALFPEYRDLSAAARLMALASWLGRVRPEWLDLDGLLAVPLPPVKTPRSVPQLLSATVLQFSGNSPDRETVLGSTRVRLLTPELDKRVSEYFGDARQFAAFLAFQAGKRPADAPGALAAAEQAFPAVRDLRVRELLRTADDMHAFLRTIAARFLAEAAAAQSGESARDRRRLEGLLAEIDALKAGPASEAGQARRALLELEVGEMMRKYHTQGLGNATTTVVTTQYTGGVSLSPRLFTVKKTAARPALDTLRAASRSAGTTWGAGWIRSGARSAAGAGAAAAVSRTRPAPSGTARTTGARTGASTPPPPAPAEAPEEAVAAPARAAAPLSSIAVPGTGAPGGSPLVGRLGEGRRIVFTRAAR